MEIMGGEECRTFICRSGQRAYHATRILLQNGFKAGNISGGMLSRSMLMTGRK